MNFTDSHAHLDELSWNALQQMYLAGVRRVVSPVQLAGGRPVSCETIRDVWDYLFDVQFARAKEHFIQPYAMIGISMVSTPRNDPAALYDLLPEYLNRPEVVAIGEIGIEPNSDTCKDLKQQEGFVRKQLEIAVKTGVRVDFHVPNAPALKKENTKRMLDLCAEYGLPFDKVIVDHCSDANIAMVLEAGAWAAISVQPWRNMTPERAADIIIEHGCQRVMVDSDCSGLPSDPLAVPKTAMALKQKGVSDPEIEKVCFSNAGAAYGL